MPVQVLSQYVRDEIFRLALDAVRREAGGPANLIGNCLEFAWHGYQLIKHWPGAPRTLIQAGSAQWPRVPPELDDGVSPTHFSYQWCPGSDVARLVRAGIFPAVRRGDGQLAFSLPEMHVWLGCPGTGELIDFSSGLWPAACKAATGLDWLAPPPPEYVWALGDRLPAGARYAPCRDAIDLVVLLLRRQGRDYP